MKLTTTIITVVFLFLNILYWFLLCNSEEINVWEIRWYLFISLFLIVGILFGVLRLYNAIVVNSKFLLGLKGEFNKIVKSNGNLERALNTTKTHYTKLTESLKSLRDIIAKPKIK